MGRTPGDEARPGAPLRVSADGFALEPPGGGRAFLRADGDVRLAVVDEHSTAPGSPELVVLDHDAAARLRTGTGEGAVARALRELRRRHPGALVAAPLQPEAPWDERPADVVIVPATADAAGAPAEILAAGLRAGGRPLLLDVTASGVEVDALLAAFDVGAAGTLVRTGDPEEDARLVREAAAADAARLDDAPMGSVIVCNHNGARYLDACFTSLARLDYPRYEVILCDDGSTDDSVAIGRRHGVRVVELEKVGLSAARNAGLHAAEGEFVVYMDGDAEAEPQLLARTWRLLDRTGADATGGPNLPYPGAGWQERAVSGAPGGSTPVVDPDGNAVLLAGCNMAFRRDSALRAGGFDAGFPGAFDDVVFMMRLADGGGRLVFHPAASIFHHRRDSISGFLRQQHNWGAATHRYEASYAGRTHEGGEVVQAATGLSLLRLRPEWFQHVFGGPQGKGLWILTDAQLHIGLPLKLATVLGGALAATLPVALLARRPGLWAATAVASVTGLFGAVAARVPVFEPGRGLSGLGLRLATAALWFAQPAARRIGDVRGRRKAGPPAEPEPSEPERETAAAG